MKYYSPSEIKDAESEIRQKFQHGRPLPLKGRCLPIFEKLVIDKHARILELGPGAGKFLEELHKKGYGHLYGCDIDRYIVPEMEEKLSDFAVRDLSFDRLPWPDNFFDAVCCWEVLEHLENPHQAIREVSRLLQPGGLFFLSLPNIFHIVSRLVFLKRGLLPQYNEKNNHLSLFPRGIFEKAVLKYFELVESGFVGPGVNLPFLKHLKFFPENEWFGRWVYYVLRKQP